MRVTLGHREEKGAFGLGKKHHFVDARIDFSPPEMEVVHSKRLDKYHLISGGDFKGEFMVSAFMGKTMSVRFSDFFDAQAFETEFKEKLVQLKTYLEVGAQPTNRTDTFEL